jgi:hypothetical protein
MEYKIPFLWDGDTNIIMSPNGVWGSFSDWHTWWTIGELHDIDDSLFLMKEYLGKANPGARFRLASFPHLPTDVKPVGSLDRHIRRERARLGQGQY